jgi:hypothetical protein
MTTKATMKPRTSVARGDDANGASTLQAFVEPRGAKNGGAARAGAKRNVESNERAALAKRALDTQIPITEWDRL